jgi:hypothetical protein
MWVENQEAVYKLLKMWQEKGGLEPAKEIFWSFLNYDRVNQPLFLAGDFSSILAEEPLVFAACGEFKIFYLRLAKDFLHLADERKIIRKLLGNYPYSLFLFSNKAQNLWHLLNVRYTVSGERARQRVFRRITIGPEERLRIAAERISLLAVENFEEDKISPLKLQQKCDEAFDVEAVTKAFFEGYKKVFQNLQSLLFEQTKDANWAHDYALQLLNRLMFLYFIQRKKWLGGNAEFIRFFWDAYRESEQPKDTFFDNWLSVLFFEAFQYPKKFQAGREDYRRRFPEEIRRALAMAPCLNGGLFASNELDSRYLFKVPDRFFETLFDSFEGDHPGFFERYNFTVSEETPLDQEVAVDPEMIGKVYESLVNVTSEGIAEHDQQGEAGIFYTPPSGNRPDVSAESG